MNAYDLLVDIRASLDEASPSHWTDLEILNKINHAYRQITTKILLADKTYFTTKSSALTPSNSQLTLPSNCVKPIYLETSDGYPIEFSLSLENRRVSRLVGTSLRTGDTDAFLLENVIEINADSFSDSCYLWYVRRIPLLHTCGVDDYADAGGAASISFTTALNPSFVDDYYNGVSIDVVSGTGGPLRDTITDYTGATGVAVVSGTYSTDSVYGTVSELPEEADPLIAGQATILLMAKPSAAIDPKYFEYFFEVYREARKDFQNWIDTRVAAASRVEITSIE